MKKRESKSFEAEWKNLFDGTELVPSDSVWDAIDLRLVHGENVSMKKQIIFYQRIAASSIALMMAFSGYFFIVKSGGDSSLNDITAESNKAQHAGKPLTSETLNSDSSSQIEVAAKADEVNKITPVDRTQAFNQNQRQRTQAIDSKVADTDNSNSSYAVPALLASHEPKESGERFSWQNNPVSSISPVDLDKLPSYFGPNDYAIAYKLADARPAVMIIKRENYSAASETQWASVGVSAGKFSPGIGGTEVAQAASSTSLAFADRKANYSTIPQAEKVTSGTSMSYFMTAGRRIFKKWILQGGVSYLNQTSNTQSNIVNVAPANQVSDFQLANVYVLETTNSVTYTTPNEINSTFQFISAPIQIGYMIVDKKIGVQINGGISPDFFVQNSVYNQSTQMDITNTSGSGESFNSVSLAGLGSIELSYGFANHYRLSLVPGLRYSLTPVYSDYSLASAKTLVTDIGLRFRYIFNN